MSSDDRAFDWPLVLLAGGKSSRLGSPKGLVALADGRLWIDEQIARFERAGGQRVVIVTGYDAAAYRAALPWITAGETILGTVVRKVRVLARTNPSPDRGPFSSLQTALLAAASAWPEAEGAWILPIDVPCGAPLTLRAMADCFTDEVDAVVPAFDGGGGHPVLVAPRFATHLRTLACDRDDARLDVQLRARPPGALVRVAVRDPAVRRNLNTREAWDQELRALAEAEEITGSTGPRRA